MKIGLFEQQMTRIIPSFAGFTEFTSSIPKLYWDVKSQEQRILAICKMLNKVICYADMLGENVDEIAHTMQEILDGKLDPMIVAAIAEWFNEHEPEITQRITELEDVLPSSAFTSESTVKDAIDNLDVSITQRISDMGNLLPSSAFTSESTVKDAIDDLDATITEITADDWVTEDRISDNAITNEKIADHSITRDKLSLNDFNIEKNFKCIDRFIVGNWANNAVIDSAQTGCMFKQGDTLYWAQYIKYATTANSHLIIRNAETNETVSDTVMWLGHGYSMSYNPNTRQIMTQNQENNTMVLINVNDVYNPFIEQSYSMTGSSMSNPIWYDDTHFLAWKNESTETKFCVSDFSMNITQTFDVDMQGMTYNDGFVSQSINYHKDSNTLYIGTTSPDGYFVIDLNELKMIDFVAFAPYYSFIYMYECETVCRLENKIYINNYERIDGVMVVSVLEHDLEMNSTPNENSWSYYSDLSLFAYVDYENGSLIPSQTKPFKLAGDALKIPKAIGRDNQGITLNFVTDYPLIVMTNGDIFRIEGANTVTIKGISLRKSEMLIPNQAAFSIEPSQEYSVGGVTYHAGILCVESKIVNFIKNSVPSLTNTDGITNPIQVAGNLSQFDWHYVTNSISCAIQNSTINIRDSAYLSKYVRCAIPSLTSN